MVSSISHALHILRRQQVQERTGLPRSTIYQLMSEGAFPRPIRLAARAVGWIEQDIQEWLLKRAEQSRRHMTASESGGRHE